MVSVDYDVFIKDVLAKLKALIAALGNYDDDPGEVYYSFVATPSGNPAARINLEKDGIRRRGGHAGSIAFDHEVELTIRIQWLGGLTEAAYQTFIEYVGEIVDAIEGSRTLASSYVNDTWITQITYSRTPRQNAILHVAYIYLTVRGVRE